MTDLSLPFALAVLVALPVFVRGLLAERGVRPVRMTARRRAFLEGEQRRSL